MSKASRKLGLTVALCTFVAAAVSPQAEITLAVGLSLAIIVERLWTEDSIPIFLMPLLYQWLQVAIKPIESVVTGEPLSRFSSYGVTLEAAVLMSSMGLVGFSVGLRFGLGYISRMKRDALLEAVTAMSFAKIAQVSFSLMIAGYLANTAAFAIAPLRQPLLAFSSVRMGGLFLLAFWAMTTGRGRGLVAVVVVADVVVGLTGFFADFRGTLLTLFLAVVAARPTFKPASIALAGVVAVFALSVAIFWSAVKPDYRSWVSGGAGQVVVRPLSERLDYMADAASKFDGRQFSKGLDALVDRISYVDYIALTMYRVPDIIPFQDGKQLGEALYHVFTPRALFPDKPPVPDDSEVTEYYTGIPIKLTGEFTSISIGYIGELYIDFGFLGAILAATAIGLFIGFLARKISLRKHLNPVASYLTLIVIAIPVGVFEIALIKFVGATVTALLAAWVLVGLSKNSAFWSFLGPARRLRRTAVGQR